jgi:hypothetical protein
VDIEQLETLAVKSAELNKDQVAVLLKATFSRTHRAGTAACYDPHHIFIFYSKDERVVGAIEVCFSCTGISTFPDTPKSYWYRHNFVALAHLADELGLWLEPRPVARYEAIQKQRNKP